MIANHYEPLMKNHRQTRRLLRCLAGWKLVLTMRRIWYSMILPVIPWILFVPEIYAGGPDSLGQTLSETRPAVHRHFSC